MKIEGGKKHQVVKRGGQNYWAHELIFHLHIHKESFSTGSRICGSLERPALDCVVQTWIFANVSLTWIKSVYSNKLNFSVKRPYKLLDMPNWKDNNI